MKTTADKLIEDYLKRLERELEDFPRARRRELVEEISSHISEARAGLEAENEAAVRNLLERLGDPADIAAEARERFGVQRKSGALDVVALVLLLVGGVVLPLIGWVVGVVLLWISNTWTTKEKLIGTFVVPGGLALPLGLTLFAGYTESCSGPPGGPLTCTGGPSTIAHAFGAILIVVLFVAPLATTAFLARQRARVVSLA